MPRAGHQVSPSGPSITLPEEERCGQIRGRMDPVKQRHLYLGFWVILLMVYSTELLL